MSLPPPRIDTTDPNQQDISEDGSDHFSSASEGHSHLHPLAPPSPNSLSPDNVPITRVERVDDSARYGEVPGTPAYEMRMQDAVPDEVEVVPEGRRPRSATTSSQPRSRSHSQLSTGSRPATPGGTPIPRTVVEKVDFKPSYGEVEGTPAKEMRMADAMPDEVRKAPVAAGARLEGRTQATAQVIEDDGTEEGRQAWFRSMWESDPQQPDPEEEQLDDTVQDAQDDDGDDDFGDDFDDFAEGGEGDEDFGDFDEADDEPPAPSQPDPSQFPTTPDILKGLPPLDLSTCTTPDEIQAAIAPYINAILPNSHPIQPTSPTHTRHPSTAAETSPFLSDRSLSLWQQLVSPPPMQPPNWTRSRIRRLFLVSLGVPVDLDEILPPSKQKRLVLPSIGLEGPSSNQLQRLKESEANDSATSIDSKTGAPRPSRSSKEQRAAKRVPKVPPPPDFDTLAAARLAATTEEALSVFSDQELQQHVLTLRVLNEEASRVLEYWLQRKDEGVKEKEALEGVIENLVGWVKGGRGGSGTTGKGGKGR